MDVDILKELSLNDLGELKIDCDNEEFFLKNAIDVAIRWKSHENPELLSVTSPNNTWKEDHSIVMIVNLELTTILVYSSDKNYTNVKRGLVETKRIDPRKPLLIYHYIFEKDVDVFPDVLRKWNRTIKEKCDTFVFAMEMSKAKAIEILLPEDLYYAKLRKEHASRINRDWPHRYPGSEGDVVRIIERNDVGYGVFAKNGDELVAWAVQGQVGRINFLHTAKEHRGKGYGKIILKVIAKSMAESGRVPVGAVLLTNQVSANLFKSVGFDLVGIGYHMVVNPSMENENE